ncbi:MAG: cysteine desulfurase family protein [Dehalococcoidales bacterium]|nr:cysteine desulfurase family protein [Dehalococcoidales bacterium]
MRTIYLDYNATTPIAPAVAEAMRPFLEGGLEGGFGNPSSSHEYGRAAHEAVDRARALVAGLLACSPEEIVFTGGGSEADNLALKGVAEAYRERGDHIITSQVEHPAVLNTCRYLERRGHRVTYLPVDGDGKVSPAEVEAAIMEGTILVSFMHANNETGTINPIAEIAQVAHRHGVLVHTDAAQSAGKVPTKVDDLGVDLLTVAGHKLYAPKGVGALYVRSGIRLEPLVHGAGHEGGRRAGTENVPYVVGLGEACRIAAATMADYAPRMRDLRDRLRTLLAEVVPGLALNGHPQERLPNTINVSFPGVDGEALLVAAPEVAASTGSACHAGRTEPSAVLLAMGLSPERALGAVRLSLGKFTTAEEVERAASALVRAWRALVQGR